MKHLLWLLIFINNSLILATDLEMDKISVNAFREEKNSWTKTSSSYEYKNESLNDSDQTSLSDILKDNPALSIISQGNSGSQTNIFLRGLDEDHVMIMIDGIIVNDPTSPNRSFNIGQLDAVNIEKIEILPGSQGFLHGSDAIAGVINIVTKAPTGKSGDWKVYGSYPQNYGVNLSQEFTNNKNAALRASVSYFYEDAISAADEDLGNIETDTTSRLQANLKGFWEINADWNLDYAFQYSYQEIDIDRGGGVGQDDPNAVQSDILMNSKLYLRYSPSKAHILKLGIGHNYTNRDSENSPDVFNATDSVGIFTGHRIRPEVIYEFQNQNYHVLNQAHYSFEQAEIFSNFNGATSDNTYDANSYSIGSKVSNPLRSQLLWELGGRYSGNPDIDSALTYMLGLGYRWRRLKLRANYSTGFKTPSLYQLFDPNFGNENLNPETSRTAEIGMDYRFTNNSKMSVNIYHNQVNDLIDFGTTYINSGELTTSGAEVSYHQILKRHWTFRLWASYVDIESSSQILRKPSYKLGGKIDFRQRSWDIFAKARLTGERDDFDFVNSQAVELDPYLLVDIGASYQLNPKFRLRANIHNLLNTDYNEVFGYTAKGINATIFLEGKF